VTLLPGLQGGDKTEARAINGLGQIVGTSNTAADPTTIRAVMWKWNSSVGQWEVTELGSLTGRPVDINDAGQIVGQFQVPGTTATHAFLWQNGVRTDLGTLPDDLNSEATAINEAGQIVGISRSATSEAHAVIWTLKTPLDQVTDLIALVDSYELDKLGTSLPDKLASVKQMLEAGDNAQACKQLNAFLNEVKAQSGKGLTSEQADELTARTVTLRNTIGC
jgi:probable HAF family extracellular repeat protein